MISAPTDIRLCQHLCRQLAWFDNKCRRRVVNGLQSLLPRFKVSWHCVGGASKFLLMDKLKCHLLGNGIHEMRKKETSSVLDVGGSSVILAARLVVTR